MAPKAGATLGMHMQAACDCRCPAFYGIYYGTSVFQRQPPCIQAYAACIHIQAAFYDCMQAACILSVAWAQCNQKQNSVSGEITTCFNSVTRSYYFRILIFALYPLSNKNTDNTTLC